MGSVLYKVERWTLSSSQRVALARERLSSTSRDFSQTTHQHEKAIKQSAQGERTTKPAEDVLVLVLVVGAPCVCVDVADDDDEAESPPPTMPRIDVRKPAKPAPTPDEEDAAAAWWVGSVSSPPPTPNCVLVM